MEFRPGVLCAEAPMNGGVGGIALPLQSMDFPAEGGLVGDTPPEAGAGQHAKLDLRHVDPTGVLGCVVELQPFNDTPGLGGKEGLVQGSWTPARGIHLGREADSALFAHQWVG